MLVTRSGYEGKVTPEPHLQEQLTGSVHKHPSLQLHQQGACSLTHHWDPAKHERFLSMKRMERVGDGILPVLVYDGDDEGPAIAPEPSERLNEFCVLPQSRLSDERLSVMHHLVPLCV
jgi:hypothetical protein